MAEAIVTPGGDVLLVLTVKEAAGLRACADEGAEGLFNDKESAKAYIGGKAAQEAAQRALAALGRGIHLARQRGGKP